jgi:hypothetical protein
VSGDCSETVPNAFFPVNETIRISLVETPGNSS